MKQVAGVTLIEPTTSRTIEAWTPNLLRAAQALANAGNLELAAEFCDGAMADDRVAAALSTRTNGLISLPLSFDAVRGTKRLVKALEAGEDFYVAYPSTELASLLRWGIMLGVVPYQNLWTDRGSTINRIVPRIKVWHPRNLRRDMQRRVWRMRVDDGREIDIEPGDGTWGLYMPYGESEPWKRGTWRSIALWHLLKSYAISDWGRYSERHGQGTVVVEYDGEDKNISKEKRKELGDALHALGRESTVVLPPGFKYELVEAEADTWETFEAQKNAADIGMSIAILGQNLSTEVSGPVATGATLHGKVLQVFIDADAETLSTCLHDQSLVWWSEFNFGNRDLAPWPCWDTKPPQDKKQSADVGKIRAETGKTLAALGVATVNEVRIAAGLEPLKEGGDELVKPAPPPPPAATTPNEEGDEKSTAAARNAKLAEAAERLASIGRFSINEVRTAAGFEPLEQGGDELVLLRSGRAMPSRSGFIQGQVYADQVADITRERAARILDEDLVAVLEAVEAGESYDAIRERLVKTFKGMSPEKLAKLTEAAITMAELGGRHAVNEDV